MGDHTDDPLNVERDQRKRGGEPELADEGPPVAKMATTYGSSFVTSEEEAAELATEETDEGSGAHAGLGGRGQPGGPAGDPPVSGGRD